MRKIAVGVTNGDTVAVTSGLKAGEQLVTQGTDKLRDGAKVTSATEPPPLAPGGHKGALGRQAPRQSGNRRRHGRRTAIAQVQ